MANKQQTAGFKQTSEALKQPQLGRKIKIDHHVATEDGIKRLWQRPAVRQQIDLLIMDVRLQRGFHFDVLATVTTAAQKIEAFLRLIQHLDVAKAIDSRLRFGQHIGINIRRPDA